MKRHLQDEGGCESFGVEARDSKITRFALNSLKNVIGGWSTGDIVSRLEPFLRRVVKDEVDRAITNFHEHSTERSLLTAAGSSRAELGLELRFSGNLPSTIFTGSKIVTDDGNPIRLELVDARTNRIVAMGPLSSMKIEILVLDGDFGADERDDWTEKDFNASIIREREGKRPLLNGELFTILRGGVGHVVELAFTDNSSWVRSRRFRLGARAVQRISADVRIREARSEHFMVKDHRGELYKKHHPPRLSDELWRLEKISRDGTFHKRLTSNGILSLKHFLRLYATNPSSLRNILGSVVPNRIWEAIVEHANECVVDDNELYGYSQPPHKHALLFNSVYQVVGASFDGQSFVSLDKLAAHQKVLVQNMRKEALMNPQDILLIDALPAFAPPRSLFNFQTGPLVPGSGLFLQPLEFPVPHQGELENMREFSHCLMSHNGGAAEPQSLEFTQAINTPGNSCVTGELWSGHGNILRHDSQATIVSGLNDNPADEENAFQVQTPSWFL